MPTRLDEPHRTPNSASRDDGGATWRFVALATAVAVIVILAIALSLVDRWRGGAGLPAPDSPEYTEMVTAFNVGVAAILIDQYDHATTQLRRATELVPGEPAAWANLGLIQVRIGEFDAAADDLGRASSLAPDSSEIWVLRGLLESRRGRYDLAVAHLEQAVELDPDHLRARYALAQEIERQGDGDADAAAESQLDEILERRGDNLAVLLDKGRLAVKRGDLAGLRAAVARIEPRAGAWPPEVRERFEALAEAAVGADVGAASTQIVFLRNVLVRVPSYRESLAAVMTSPDIVGEPLERFLVLPMPAVAMAPADVSLSYATEPLAEDMVGPWSVVAATSLDLEGAPVVFVADAGQVRRAESPGPPLEFPGGPPEISPTADGIRPFDWNYDFRTDLALAGAAGLRLLEQREDGEFQDVTAQSGLPAEVIDAAYVGAWAADLELDGDLDLVLGSRTGPTMVARNNGDGTFRALDTFAAVENLRGFVWVDLDGDGDPDVALLDADGHAHFLRNDRAGAYAVWPSPPGLEGVVALAPADVDGDAVMEIVVLQSDGAVLGVSSQFDGRRWDVRELVRWSEVPAALEPGGARVFVADVDNNGGMDVLTSAGSRTGIWLRDPADGLRPLDAVSDLEVFEIADLTDDGLLDLVGLSPTGQPMRAVGSGSAAYHWQVVRPRATRGDGDQRINAFALGGQIQVRSGLLVQRQAITQLPVHFGLGERTGVDVARVVWPNGVFQAEFDLDVDQVVRTEQRLKGSCPWLYGYDGAGMRFVTDFLWRSPLGLRINAQETAGVTQTEDWIKVRGDQLKPKDGLYDLRITGELWETFFFDQVALMVVDHPEGTDVFVDERFSARQQAPLEIQVTAPPRPVAQAWDDLGNDVTDVVRRRDDRHLGTFGRGAYQGITRDHYVEVALDDEAPRDGRLWLIAYGWVYPTDSSINVAIAQGGQPPPRGLALEVMDQSGAWVVAYDDLGFPAGKRKTVLIDLTGVFRPGAPRRLRLRTNLEVYWDSLETAVAIDGAPMDTTAVELAGAELRYRGFSRTGQANVFAPEVPDYDTIAGTGQRWLDLVGYHTRFGEVGELLGEVDDRYVIMNAGDELALGFRAPPPVRDGWVRDYVLKGDGWIKDGDFNTGFSRTVLPLPAHDDPAYATPPGRLEDDPVYRRHAEDWIRYHTRYVTPDRFRAPLRGRASGGGPASDG